MNPPMPRLLLLCLLCISLRFSAAQEAAPPVPAMREVSPGIFELGKIRLDQKARTISLPATVNKANDDLLEYLLVTPDGARHESLLVSEVAPRDVHFAMLLLGAKGSGEKHPTELPPGQLSDEFLKKAPKPKGDTLSITVKWKTADGSEKSASVEDWLLDPKTKKAVARGPWLYSGSMFFEGIFIAQQEGCFAALVINPNALINNPRKGNDSDEAWTPNTKAIPPVDTPLTLTITLEKIADEPSAPTKPAK